MNIDFAARRERMVREQIEARGITDKRVLDAMMQVERHKFVPGELIEEAYDDHPITIGRGQTISQPYIVAYMSEALSLTGKEKVLEIGTGSGYQAAVLSFLAGEVYSVEIIPEIAAGAKERIEKLGYRNIMLKQGDGYKGWKEFSPFDRIIATCAPDNIPTELASQLAEGGKMILPVGRLHQEIVIAEKTKGLLKTYAAIPVRFVPMVHDSSPK